MNKYLNFSPLYFFGIYCMVFIAYSVMATYILFDDALYYSTFGEILGAERVEQLIEKQKVYQKFGYLLIPVLLLLRPLYTATCLTTGALLSEQTLKFGQCFNIALKTDAVFLLEVIIRINYFSIVGAASLQEINTPLFSLLHWIGAGNVEPYLTYPLGVFSVFEAAYWIFLSMFIAAYTKKNFWRSLYFVLTTYGVGLLLLVISVIYIASLFS